MTPGIGHNRGPGFDGLSWRRHAWSRARADLLPTLPVEVVRLRVRRAQELGLPYRTYAGIRASTGRDLIGFLFSSNALRVLKSGQPMPPERAERLAAIRSAGRVALVQPPIDPALVAATAPVDAADRAPGALASWPVVREAVLSAIATVGGPPDGWLVVGETWAERDWSEAGKTAGFLTGERFFAAP